MSPRAAARRARRTKSPRTEPPVAPPAHPREIRWPLLAGAALLVVAGVLPLANMLTNGPGLAWYPSAAWMWLAWGGGLAAATLALSSAATQAVERVVQSVDRIVLAPARVSFAAIIGAVVLALSLYFGWLLLGLQATAGDEFAQRWQSTLLAGGRLHARAVGPPEFFSTLETLEVDGRWFSHFPIGGPAVMTLGLLAHAPWLVNPVLTVLGVWAIHHFVARTVDERSARWAAICCALSPYLLFMAGSQMNHVPTLACTWIALAALTHWTDAESERTRSLAAAIAGVAIGSATAIRPYDGALLALAVGSFQLVQAWRHPALRRSLAVQCVAGAVPIAAMLAVNAATTGHAFSFAYDVLNGAEHRPGFHVTPLGWVHSPRRGLYAISAYLLKLDMMLLGWPVPAVLLAALGLVAVRRATRWDALLLAVLFTTLGGYLAYWGESYFMGPRFLYSVAPILIIYAARLPVVLRERLERPAWRAASMAVPFVWLSSAWLLPADVDRMFGVTTLASTAVLPRSAAPVVDRAVRANGVRDALVFVPESWHGRLAARLRALGVRPLQSEEIVKSYDACTLQRALDTVELQPSLSAAARMQSVSLAVQRDAPAVRLDGMTAIDQIALVPGRRIDSACEREYATARSSGITLAELLPYMSLDATGAPDGPIVYARDMGVANERLRPIFGDRRWLVLRLARSDSGTTVSFDPYVPGGVPAAGERAPASGSR